MCTYVFIEYERPTLRDLYKFVVPKCAHKWRYLGALLHFDQTELGIIFSNFRNDSEECCRNLLSRWLEKTTGASWNQIFSAIDDVLQPKPPEIAHQGMNQSNRNTTQDVVTFVTRSAKTGTNSVPNISSKSNSYSS